MSWKQMTCDLTTYKQYHEISLGKLTKDLKECQKFAVILTKWQVCTWFLKLRRYKGTPFLWITKNVWPFLLCHDFIWYKFWNILSYHYLCEFFYKTRLQMQIFDWKMKKQSLLKGYFLCWKERKSNLICYGCGHKAV